MPLKRETAVRLKWYLTVVLTIVGVYLCFRYLLPLLLPFVFAYFIAWLIRPTTEFLYKKIKMPRMIGGTLSLLALLSLVGTGIYFLFDMLLKQLFEFMKNLPVYFDIIAGKLDAICSSCDRCFGLKDGSIRIMIDDNLYHTMNRIKTNVMPRITERSITYLIIFIGAIGVILIVLVAALLIVKDLPDIKARYQKNVMYQDIHKVTKKLAEVGVAYIRTQFIIMVIVAVVCVIGLVIIKNDYAFLLGIGIAIMDALPVLGSGLILIPWSFVMLMNGNIYSAAILITIFFICQIIREIMEPKLLGNRIGIKPLFTLIAMYIGIKLFNFAGFFLGPIGLVIIMTIIRVVAEKTDISDYRNVPNRED